MILTLEIKYPIGTKVRFNNKIGKDEGIVCGYNVKGGNVVMYNVVWSDKKDLVHYDFELEELK